jgi:hypothetical protein
MKVEDRAKKKLTTSETFRTELGPKYNERLQKNCSLIERRQKSRSKAGLPDWFQP